MSDTTIPCTVCGGSGWYVPAFNLHVEINCASCNESCLSTRELRRRQKGAVAAPRLMTAPLEAKSGV